jgi:hypothetical protein
MSCIFGENRDIFFPKLSENLHLITFAEIAEKYLKQKGLVPFLCQTEAEARSFFKHATRNTEHETPSNEHGTLNNEHGTTNKEQRTRNKEQRTTNNEHGTCLAAASARRAPNNEHRTQNNKQQTTNPEPGTRNPNSSKIFTFESRFKPVTYINVNMEIITIQFSDRRKIPVILNLLNKLNLDLKINVIKSKNEDIHNNPPVQWASGKPSISDFDGFWEENSITLEELRQKAWKRS